MRSACVGAALAVAAVVAACGGTVNKPATTAQSVDFRGVRQDWVHELHKGARENPRLRFPSPSKSTLLARLRRAQHLYGFTTASVDLLQPVQTAPAVVIVAEDREKLVRAIPAIMRLLDPKRPTGDDRTGWEYEGFYLEARDARGKPFVAVFNFMRGHSRGGGQAAHSEELLPFPHG